MSEVYGSTATGSTAPSSTPALPSPSTVRDDGALGSFTVTSPSAAAAPEARAQAVQSTFLGPPSGASRELQSPPLFGNSSLLPFRNRENAFSGASTTLPQSEPSYTGTDQSIESDVVAEFDQFLGDEPEPEDVRQFFAALNPADRERLAAERAEAIGKLDGAPAALRDVANRQLMQRDLEQLGAKAEAGTLTGLERRALENIHAVQSAIAKIEARTDLRTAEPLTSQLYVYEPSAFGGDGRVAVSVGDLDAADHVAVMVSGFGSRTARMNATEALNVYVESRETSVDTRRGVAVLNWVGYDAPSGGLFSGDAAGVVTQRMARAGAERLASEVVGLHDMRGGHAPHLTVAAHSYGATVAAIAADEFGLAAADLILLGSPGGGGAADANDLTTGRDHTWVGSASRDFVTSLAVTGALDPTQLLAAVHGIPPELLGADPAEDDFNARRFQAEHADRGSGWNITDHLTNRYYGKDTEPLFNVAAIVTGSYDNVLRAEPRRDPWYAPLQDPERQRMPRAISP